MLHAVLLPVLAVAYGANVGDSRSSVAAPKQLIFYGPSARTAEQYAAPNFQYDPNLLIRPFHPVNFVNDKQTYPRLQPQVLLYTGGAPPGQQFLIQPGAPPGNFLVPQPQPSPGFVLRDGPPRPEFSPGIPKSAYTPPIEKDAEEIPTSFAGNRASSRPLGSKPKPEKIETLDEQAKTGPAGKPEIPGESEVFEKDLKTNNKKSYPRNPSLKPGHRYFILNGQSQFPSYPFRAYLATEPELLPKHAEQPLSNIPIYRQHLNEFLRNDFQNPSHFEQQNFDPQLHQVPIQNFFLRNAVTGQISDVQPNFGQNELESQVKYEPKLISLNQPDEVQQNILLRNAFPISISSLAKQTPSSANEYSNEFFRGISPSDNSPVKFSEGLLSRNTYPAQIPSFAKPESHFDASPDAAEYDEYKSDDDTVVIDVKAQDDKNEDDSESEGVSAADSPAEPSVAQAQPGAIALAGAGGVAAAGPRGTAIVGEGGLAVSSPRASAVAGPSEDEPEKKNKTRKGKQ